MYLSQILWFIAWPVIIALSYVLIRLALKKFEENEQKQG